MENVIGDKEIFMLQVECTLFFEKNPYAYQTTTGLSMRLGRTAEVLEPVLERLIEVFVLEKVGSGSRALYRYVAPYVAEDIELDRSRR
ncbi:MULTISPECIES: hypothetical protein [Saccharibacillus]|uniref:hypothetical protein n=1 Tax=Saccharibacillus TaxID=456492 RepID=UPI00301D3E72